MKWLLYYLAADPLIKADEIGFTGPRNADNTITGILNAVYFWMAVTAIGFIIYGGYLYITSSGEPGKIKKAKDVLLYATVGIVIVLVAFVVTQFVINGVG